MGYRLNNINIVGGIIGVSSSQRAYLGNNIVFEGFVSNILDSSSNSNPIISNFRINDVNKDRIYFDSSETITGSTVTGFYLGGNSGTTITGVTINDISTTGHYFTVDVPFDFWDNDTIRYEGISGGTESNIGDLNGNGLYDFTLTYIFNDIPEPTSTGTTYYVDIATGNNVNSGLIGSPWSGLTYALRDGTVVTDGDIVYVKAGDYGAEQVRSYVGSSSATNPVKVIGYKTSPTETDISSMYYTDLETALDASEMPLFDGGNTSVGEGFWQKEDKANVIYKNLQFQNYRKGFTLRYGNDNFLCQRIIVKNIGDITTGTDGRGFNQNSEGFSGSDKMRFKDIIAMNCNEMNFGFSGNHILAENITSWNDRTNGAGDSDLVTDYYCLMNGSNNIVRNSLLDKHCNTGFGGHGYSWKASTYMTEYNLTENSTAINIAGAFNSRHGLSRFNVFKNNESHANVAYAQIIDDRPSGFAATNGASYNIYENNYIHHTNTCFNTSGGAEDNAADGGTGNIFRNNIVHDIVEHAISFSNSATNETKLNSDNKFYNNTFYNIPALFKFSTSGFGLIYSGNEFKNNLISNITNFYDTSSFTEAYSAQTIIDYNNFYSGFTSQGTNSFELDPNFVDTIDFVPQNVLLNTGTTLLNVSYDTNGVERRTDNTTTIGAVEINNP